MKNDCMIQGVTLLAIVIYLHAFLCWSCRTVEVSLSICCFYFVLFKWFVKLHLKIDIVLLYVILIIGYQL